MEGYSIDDLDEGQDNQKGYKSLLHGMVPLEYAIAGQDNPLAQEESEIRERALLYVSTPRAKKGVLITSYDKKSRFL